MPNLPRRTGPATFFLATTLFLVNCDGGWFVDPPPSIDGPTPATLTGVRVRPAEATVDTGATRTFEAAGVMSDGTESAVAVAWSATGGQIDGQGRFTAGPTPGIFHVAAAHADGYADTAAVTVVVPAPPAEPGVARVVVSPAADTLDALGQSLQLSARAEDASGAEMEVTFEWTSLDGAVAGVDATGRVTARAVGTALVVAAAAGCADTAVVVVRQVPASVAVDPAAVTLVVGQTRQLEPTVYDAGGAAMPGAGVTWGSFSPDVATATGTGLVQGLKAGTAVITATSGAARGEARVDVEPAPPAPADTFRTNQRPYTADSPWNTVIPANAAIDPESDAMVATILASSNGKLRSDPTQYAYPVHFANGATPRTTLVCTGYVSTVHADGTRTSAPDGKLTGVPIPASAVPSEGTDGQIIVIDKETGDEYDIWRFVPPNGCTNATKYVSGVYRSAVETSYTSRGAGVPYLAGLIRPWEIAQGRIEHALAFAYTLSRAERCVWPASKTDGDDDRPDAIPEGARLRLDPSLDVDAIPGLDRTGRIIARALQEYGMFLIDNSGANKLYPEDNLTASWGTKLVTTTVSAIPVDRLQVLRLPDAYWAPNYVPNHGDCVR